MVKANRDFWRFQRNTSIFTSVPFGPFQIFLNVGAGQFYIRDRLAIHFYNFVAGTKTNSLGGSATNRGNNNQCILKNIKLYTNAFKISFQVFIRFYLFRVREYKPSADRKLAENVNALMASSTTTSVLPLSTYSFWTNDNTSRNFSISELSLFLVILN